MEKKKHRIPFGKQLIPVLICCLFTAGCEEEFVPPASNADPELVVEGFIEAGENALPTYVLISKTLPFFKELTAEDFNNAIVRNARVNIRSEGKEIELTELCLSELSPELREAVLETLGWDVSNLRIDICAYVDIDNDLPGEAGKDYELIIETEDGETLTAVTSIPRHVPLDSIWFEDPPGEPTDTFVELWARIQDPGDRTDYYRYMGAENGEAIRAGFASVTDDAFFDGQEFDFTLSRPQQGDEEIDPEEFGLYRRGDTVDLKWCNIDEAHFRFWQSIEAASQNQGPFSSYTRVSGNINGGLGIWGGYSVSHYRRIVPYK